MSDDWTTTKPTEPGVYQTRWLKDGSNQNTVEVTRKGRGLSVFCATYGDRVPMSGLESGTLEWKRVEAADTKAGG